MKRIVNALSKLNWGMRAYTLIALCVVTAIALSAQTSPRCTASMARTAHTRTRGWSRPPMGTCTGQRPLAGPTASGTVFKMTPSGTLTTLYSFCSQSGCTDGD